VMAFMQDLEVQQTDDKVVGMTFSEFGRRIVSNASLGTDHGNEAENRSDVPYSFFLLI